MKTSYILGCAATAMLAVTPVMAHAARNDLVERCMDTFVAEHFPNSKATYVVENDYGPLLPLALNSGTFEVKVTASEPATGRVLGTATCAVSRNSVRIGEVSVAPINNP